MLIIFFILYVVNRSVLYVAILHKYLNHGNLLTLFQNLKHKLLFSSLNKNSLIL